MPATKKTTDATASGKNRRDSRHEASEEKGTRASDIDVLTDVEYERAHNEFREKLGIAPIDDGDKSQKRKRVLTAKAKAALEQDYPSSDESVEPRQKRKSHSQGTRKSAVTTETGYKPINAHPASLVRLKSPIDLTPSSVPPPKLQRKFKSYKDAVSGESASSAGEETMSSKEGPRATSPGADDGNSSASSNDAGSLVDFIDDRAEDDLSLDSADSIEEPNVRKSRLSKKRSARSKGDTLETGNPRAPAGAQGRRHGKEKGTLVPEPIVISSDSDGGRVNPRARIAKGSSKPQPAATISDDGERKDALKGASTSRNFDSRTRNQARSKSHRDQQIVRVEEEKKRSSKAIEHKRKANKDKRTAEESSKRSRDRRDAKSRSGKSAGGDNDDEQMDTDVDIDWPPTPEPISKRRSKKASRMVQNTEEARDAKSEVELQPGQDVFLADTYGGMEPLKPVELIPLFGSQDPPEEEALKLTDLLRLYERTPASTYLPQRLRNLSLFQQQNVLVNAARAKLSKVATSGYGTSLYFIMPASVVRPRNGALPFYTCFLVTGVCAYCYLFKPAEKTFGTRSIVDHRIGVYPIEFEYQRGLTFMGNVAKKSALRYSFTSGILALTSKTEGSGESNNANFGASPKKSAFHRDRTVPAAQSSAANPNLEHLRTSRFPAALSYTDQVPVFDARGSNFLTGPFDLALLHTLPLITEDVEESSVVTVGFTSNTYVSTTGSLAGVDVLSMNVQFVVVHAGPPP